MKKIVIMMLLFVSTNVLAEWTKVSAASVVTIGDFTVYADIQSIRKNGNKVKMWKLVDFKTVQNIDNVRYLSMLVREEYDCLEETSRRLDGYEYSGNMKNGDIVTSLPNLIEQSETVIPGSVIETLLKVACGGK